MTRLLKLVFFIAFFATGTCAWAQTAVRIHAGGPAYTDSLGQAWSADAGFSGGVTDGFGVPIANTNDPALYQNERFGTFSYSFAMPAGNYAVTLKFAEIYWSLPGERIFNVAINGSTVLSNFDIVDQAGGPDIAVDETFPVNASNGNITIQFLQGSADQPKVSAIQIVPAGASSILINSGGPAYTDSGNQFWSADTGFDGGVTDGTGSPIANTNDPALYQTERFGNLSYNFAVPAGNYSVTLKFAEIYWSSPGQRIFNVAINGTTVLPNFDIVAQAGGPFIALDKTFGVNASGGNITIQFLQGAADQPKISAIQIVPAGVTSFFVHSGGQVYTDSLNQPWSADTGFSGGTTDGFGVPIANTNDPSLYQTERFGNFSYNFAVPAGNYAVTLKFAEIYWSSPGRRIFNVAINGTTELSNFDIVAQAGGPDIALDETFPVNASSGNITIQFLQGPVDNPKVSAVQILPMAAPSLSIEPSSQSTSVGLGLGLGSALGAVSSDVSTGLAAGLNLISANPTSLSFGAQNLETNSTAGVAITNGGNSYETITNVSVSGGAYSVAGISTGQILSPGATVMLGVTFTPAATGSLSGSVTITSDASSAPATISLIGTGIDIFPNYVGLNWVASASTVSGYNAYRSSISGGPYTRINSNLIATTSYADTTVQAGQTYFYVVTSVDASGNESVFSNETAATIPIP